MRGSLIRFGLLLLLDELQFLLDVRQQLFGWLLERIELRFATEVPKSSTNLATPSDYSRHHQFGFTEHCTSTPNWVV